MLLSVNETNKTISPVFNVGGFNISMRDLNKILNKFVTHNVLLRLDFCNLKSDLWLKKIVKRAKA